MKNQLIEQIKAMPGIKEVQAIGYVAVVVFGEVTPKKTLIYTDQEDGTEFFEGDEVYWFSKETNETVIRNINDVNTYEEETYSSKIFKSLQLCELALAKFIQDKYK